MTHCYEPKSEFLKAVAAGNVPLSGDEPAETNLRRLLRMMRDADRANRDWATFLLAQSDLDTAVVREALLQAVKDGDDFVRAEAICGLAQRDALLALPFVQEALRGDSVAMPIFEAAGLCAHPSLVEDLRKLAQPSDSPELDAYAADALAACERGFPPD